MECRNTDCVMHWTGECDIKEKGINKDCVPEWGRKDLRLIAEWFKRCGFTPRGSYFREWLGRFNDGSYFYRMDLRAMRKWLEVLDEEYKKYSGN